MCVFSLLPFVCMDMTLGVCCSPVDKNSIFVLLTSIGSDIGDISTVTPFCTFKEDYDNLYPAVNSVKIGSMNANSILHEDRLNQIENIISKNSFSIFCIQESKLDPSKDPSCYHISGYNVVEKHRNARGGGLLIYLHSSIAFRRLPELESSCPTLEHLCVEVFFSNKKILVNNIYRPPNSDTQRCLQNLKQTTDRIKSVNSATTIYIGDANAGNNYCFYGSLTTRSIDFQISEIFEDRCFSQIIDLPSRTVNNCSSLLDVIYIDRSDLVSSAVLFPPLADHAGISLSLDISWTRPKTKKQTRYQFDNISNETWTCLKKHFLSFQCLNEWSADEHAVALTDHLTYAIEEFVPKVSFNMKNKDLNWDSRELRRALRKKNRMYKCYRKISSQYKCLQPGDNNYFQMAARVSQSYLKFREASNSYKKQSRRSKNVYFNSLKNVWCNASISAKKKFDILKKLTRTTKNCVIPPLIEDGKVVNDPQEQAQIFNKFFAGKSTVINPGDTPPSIDKLTTNEPLDKLDTSFYEIGPQIKSLKSSNFSHCGVPATFIKNSYKYTGSVISKLISDLINRIFHTGNYPHIFKIAHVTPVFKGKDKTNKINYRPISLLPTLSKICEAVLHHRLLRHLISNKVISKCQAAYIPSDSTAQQLTHLIHQIKLAMSSNKVAHGVFLDVSAAFDAVWHQGLLKKLEQINITGEAFKVFTSYLANRRVVTTIDGSKSDELPLTAGVPQGSRLGPLMFIIYINDIVADLECIPYIYADDCSLLAIADNTFETTNMLNRDLFKITMWAHKWKLTFNPLKSKDIIFSTNPILHHPSYPTIMGLHIIDRVTLHKHLGVFIQSDLSWQKHIEYITRKVNLKLSIIWKVKELTRHCLDVLCKLHIRASIDYCLTVFGPCLNQLQISKLDSLLYRAGKICTGALKFTSRDKVLKELGWENTSKRLEYLSLCQFHKIMHLNTTELVRECLPPPNVSRYPTKRTFQNYPCKKTCFTNSFFPYTIKKWDSLKMDIKGLSLTDFKSKLKELMKPMKFKHFNVGHKLNNQLHAQLRLGRSKLNSHLHQIGLSITPTCKCGQLETVKHFLLDCKLHDVARLQLYEKLGGLLENRVSTYSKSKLCEILLYGEKPEMLEKYTHNKFIFFSVQKFINTVHRYHFVNDPNDL